MRLLEMFTEWVSSEWRTMSELKWNDPFWLGVACVVAIGVLGIVAQFLK